MIRSNPPDPDDCRDTNGRSLLVENLRSPGPNAIQPLIAVISATMLRPRTYWHDANRERCLRRQVAVGSGAAGDRVAIDHRRAAEHEGRARADGDPAGNAPGRLKRDQSQRILTGHIPSARLSLTHRRLDRSDIAAIDWVLILRFSLIIWNRSAAVMLQALVITLREGFEAFLIVAISLSYLRKSGRVGAHLGGPLGHRRRGRRQRHSAAYLLFNSLNQEWLDGPLALVAAASVAWMIVHMWRTGRRMKGDIEGRLQGVHARAGHGAPSPASSSSRC